MNVDHLTVYYDPEWNQRDEKGLCLCVDIDSPDLDDKRQSGGTGARFDEIEPALEFIKLYLEETRKALG